MSRARLALIRSQHGGRRRRWTRARVKRLCQILAITEAELVAYLDWELPHFRRCMERNDFPGPVCIVLDLFERYAFRVMLDEELDFQLPFPTEHSQ